MLSKMIGHLFDEAKINLRKQDWKIIKIVAAIIKLSQKHDNHCKQRIEAVIVIKMRDTLDRATQVFSIWLLSYEQMTLAGWLTDEPTAHSLVSTFSDHRKLTCVMVGSLSGIMDICAITAEHQEGFKREGLWASVGVVGPEDDGPCNDHLLRRRVCPPINLPDWKSKNELDGTG